MWRKLFRPDVLFFASGIQAVLPYLIWALRGPTRGYQYVVSYLPAVIWCIGCTSFWIGTRLAGQRRSIAPQALQLPAMWKIKVWLALFGLILAIQMYGTFRVYGNIPLLAYAAGEMNVNDMNELQAQSGFGQIGLFALTLFLLNGIILLLILKAATSRNSTVLWLLFGLATEILASTSVGKRQGLFMTCTYLACGTSLRFGSPFAGLRAVLPRRFGTWTAKVVAVASIIGVIYVTGALASLRTLENVQRSGLDEILLYYQLPTLNMEKQCEFAGLGPYSYNLLDVFKTLIPAKSSILQQLPFGDPPPKPEVSSPSGFYERIHWSLGLPGVIGISMIIGFLAQKCYLSAFRTVGSLLIYSQMAWALVAASLYNHFFNLVFLPLPAAIFWIAGRLMAPPERRRMQGRASAIENRLETPVGRSPLADRLNRGADPA